MKKNRIEENKTDKHLAEKNQIEKNLIVDRLTVTYGEKLAVDGVKKSMETKWVIFFRTRNSH